MRVITAIVLILNIAACHRPNDCSEYERTIDSLTATLEMIQLQYDSLKQSYDSIICKYYEERAYSKLAELQVKRYADIVTRDPKQVVHLRGWINRAYKR